MRKAQAAPAAAAVGVSAAPATPQLPPFLMKLWAILEDSRNDSMITWSPDGQKVCILDDQRFAYQLLPKYFKHCNLSSFVRQLYSYGFKKVMSIKNGTMVAVNNSPMEFQHPYFIQRKPELLVNIQRKVPTPKEPAAGSIDLQAMLSEFRAVREHQNNISLKLDTMARDSTYLIKRMASLQKKDNQQQQHVLSQILQIIVNWMSEKGRLDAERKRSQNDASEAPRPKNSRPQARSAMEGRETAAVPGHSADRKDLIVTPKIEGEAGGAAGTSNGQAVVHERRGTRVAQVLATGDTPANNGLQTVNTPLRTTAAETSAMKLLSAFAAYANKKQAQSGSSHDRKELQAFLNFFCSNTVEIGALLSEKFNSISEILTETFVPERQDLDVKFEGALDGSLKNETLATGMNEQEAPRRNDLQLFQNRANPMLGEPPTIKMEYGSNVPLGASVENRPPVPFSGQAPVAYIGPVYQVPTLLLLNQPLFFGNVYGNH